MRQSPTGGPYTRVLRSWKTERLAIALGDNGYLPVAAAERPVEAGPTLAVVVVREAGGQLHRRELLDQLMARGRCRERAAAKYLGRAVQAGELRSVRDGAQAVYQVVAKEEP